MDERAARGKAEREASRWIARLEGEDVSLGDHRRFRRWLAASTRNRTAYEALSRTWDKLDLAGKLEAPAPQAAPPRSGRNWLAVGLIASVAAVILAFAAPQLLAPRGELYATAIGEHVTRRLADGSTIEMNADARLRVAYSATERRVRLTRGEALFDVERDPERPFVVETAFGDVRVLGTSFIVGVGERSARATVLRGTVSGAPRAGLWPRAETRSVRAGANEEITLNRTGAESTPLAPAVIERRIAWRSGMLIFDGESLREAAREVERQTGQRFVIADAALAETRVGGLVRVDDADAFTALIRDNVGVAVEEREDGAIVFHRARERH